MDELKRRFGAAAKDVMDAYTAVEPGLNEIVAVHLADPNMYIWPEINPGGLVESYREVLPSDWRYMASIPEAVRNRVEGVAVRQTDGAGNRGAVRGDGAANGRSRVPRQKEDRQTTASGCLPSRIS